MNFPSKVFISFLYLFLSGTIAIHAANYNDSAFWRVKKTADFAITGDGSCSSWDKAEWLILPKREGAPVNYQTKFKILYSDAGLYCLYFCEDSKITAFLKEDFSDLYNEDVVEVFLWTDEGSSIYFEYELSPLNVELPILVPNFNGKFLGWRPWHYEGKRKTRHVVKIQKQNNYVVSWTAEIFIPFALLDPLQGVPAKSGMFWRANFYRIDYDQGPTEWSWQAVQTNFHDYKKFGVIVFE